jgi:FtsZ-binding cell division protein ZapB
MKKEDIATNEAETTIAPAVEVKAEAQVETPVEAKEENKVETSVETTAILNELSELKTNFSTLENELKIAKEQNETFKSEINKLKEDKKAELINLANVPNKNEVTEVKTVEDFKNKYSTK